jgi:hypothetical protein
MSLTRNVPDAALLELRALYERFGAELEPFRRHCAARGHCCNFTQTGHMLFLTDLEAAEMARCGLDALPSQQAAGCCPYLRGTSCGAREFRALGCRLYFCDGTYEENRNALCEIFLKEIRAIEARHQIPHNYRPVTAIDFKEFAA